MRAIGKAFRELEVFEGVAMKREVSRPGRGLTIRQSPFARCRLLAIFLQGATVFGRS
jgi:hypothetical protein